MKKFAALLIALGLVIMSLGLMSTSASADLTTVPCGTPAKPAVYETVRVKVKDAVPAQPAVAPVYEYIDHPAVLGEYRHWVWNPQGPYDESLGAPSWPTPSQGRWNSDNRKYKGEPAGAVQMGEGNEGDNASYFYWEILVEPKDAWNEEKLVTPGKDAVPAQDAVYEDRQVLVTPAVPAGEPCKTPTPEPCPDDSLDPVTCEPTETPTEKPTPPREQPKPPVGTPDQDTSERPSKTPVAVPTAVAAGVSTLPDTGAVDFTAGLIAGGLLIGAGTLIAYKSRRRGTREA